MKLHAVIRAYTESVHGLIRDCETTNTLETLDSIEDKFEAIHAMYVRIMTKCTDEDIVKMRVSRENTFAAFERARKAAFTRLSAV